LIEKIFFYLGFAEYRRKLTGGKCEFDKVKKGQKVEQVSFLPLNPEKA
jgi:hypothetical protein